MKLTGNLFRVIVIVATVIFTSSLLPAQDYVLLGWNDLGMHCSNKYFSKVVVLPPYNNVTAQLIMKQQGQLPQILSSGYTIEYSIPGNTYSVGKTDFWTYAQQLFGLPSPLPANIGLTGKGLTGVLDSAGSYSIAHGIPITPFPDNDLVNESPFQLIHLVARSNSTGNVLATTDAVIPVSNEVGCVQSGCHSSETNILNQHEDVSGFNASGPVLCASCHASNALGTTGNTEAMPFSYRMHDKHRSVAGPSNSISTCYKCHPGPNTQCLRDTMANNTSHPMICQDCHGTMTTVASTILAGRRPWLDEPRCGTCHGSEHSEETGKLFRQSKGHGGLFCSACHGSPHAIQPTRVANDNLQNIRLQGHAGTLRECSVCHASPMTSPGPHGVMDTRSAQAATPVLSSPANRSIEVSRSPVLQWAAAQYAQTYQVQVAADSLFATVLFQDSGVTQTSYSLSSLDSAALYYWRIRAVNTSGASEWSTVWSFTTSNASIYSFGVESSWNIISLPLRVTNSLVSALFSHTASNAFAYLPSSGYAQRDSLERGKGYWLKFSSGGVFNLTGTAVTSETVQVSQGWNMIGSLVDSIPTSSIISQPPGIVSSAYYGFHTGYQAVTMLAPAKGYWVKTTTAGQLILSLPASSVMKSGNDEAMNALRQCDYITFTDRSGSSQRLYIGSDRLSRFVPYFELPPVAPGNTFDARFASGRLLETYSSTGMKRFPVSLLFAEYPLSVEWNVQNASMELQSGSTTIQLSGTGSTVLADASAAVTILASGNGLAPSQYVLEDAYPNPFNPATTIRYQLPVDSKVSVKIYNMLGEVVATLVNGDESAGYRTVEWNASANASGVYLCRFEAVSNVDPLNSFQSVKKVLLVK